MADDDRAQADAARARTGFTGPICTAGEALRMVQRHRNYSGIVQRQRLGIPLTPEELDALDALDRGDKLRTGPKDPGTDIEAVVTYRWMTERDGLRPSAAQSMLAEMMGVTSGAIRGRLLAKGLGENIAALTFDRHVQCSAVPALLRHRTPAGHCNACKRVRCRCDTPPRPAFFETPEGATATALLSFWTKPPLFGPAE